MGTALCLAGLITRALTHTPGQWRAGDRAEPEPEDELDSASFTVVKRAKLRADNTVQSAVRSLGWS